MSALPVSLGLSRVVSLPRALTPGTLGALRFRLGRVIPTGVQLAAVAAIAAVLVLLSYGMNHTSYVIWGALWVAPVLFVLSVPIANRAARHDGPAIGRIVLVAAVVKVLVAPLLRYWMAYGLYGGLADSARYHLHGAQLAPLFRQGIYHNLGEISGTRVLDIVTGHVYALTGPTRLGGFVVFSWFSFLGCYLFYRAFRVGYPEGDGRRYALLIFFFPTLLFWPASIGKEAFMVLVLGAAAFGAARLIAGRWRSLGWLALGLWGVVVVRPHIALIFGAGLAAAALVAALRGGAPSVGARRQRSRLGGAVMVFILLLAGPILIGVFQNFFGVESLNTETAQELLDETTRRTVQSHSAFRTYSPNNPVGFVLSGVTVLFRPFPFEAHNAQAMITSLEGLVLLTLAVLSLRRVVRLPREQFRWPYIALSAVYMLAFIYAFSSMSSFGILARQRSQLLPLLFVLLCLPRRRVEQVPERVGASPQNPA